MARLASPASHDGGRQTESVLPMELVRVTVCMVGKTWVPV